MFITYYYVITALLQSALFKSVLNCVKKIMKVSLLNGLLFY